jgi:hypothetical protein
MQHVFVIKIVDAIGLVKAYEIIGIEWFLKYAGILDLTDLWWRMDIAEVNAIQTSVGKRQFQKGTFVYFILDLALMFNLPDKSSHYFCITII